jgi:hypothetical protein
VPGIQKLNRMPMEAITHFGVHFANQPYQPGIRH